MARGILSRWRCRRLRAALVDRSAGTSHATEAAALDRHLPHCAACQEALETLREVASRLRDEPARPSEHWARQRDAVMAAVRRLPAPDPPVDWRFRLAWGAAAAAAVIVVLRLRAPAVPPQSGQPTSAPVENLDDATLLALIDVMATMPGGETAPIENDGMSALTEPDLQNVAALLGDS